MIAGGYGGYGSYPPVAPFYVQSPQYPILTNPPNYPTYSYGIPPSPVLSHHGFGGHHGQSPPMHGLRRAGSINAKIMSAVRGRVLFLTGVSTV